MTQAEPPQRAAIYARSATTQETEASFATDAQIRACFQYANANGYQVVPGQVYRETASGMAPNREMLTAVLSEAKNGTFAVLLIYNCTRLARHPSLLETLISQFAGAGVTVVSVTEPCSPEAAEQLACFIRTVISEALSVRRSTRKKQPADGYLPDTASAPPDAQHAREAHHPVTRG